jgi:hypothetical protein
VIPGDHLEQTVQPVSTCHDPSLPAISRCLQGGAVFDIRVSSLIIKLRDTPRAQAEEVTLKLIEVICKCK